VLRWVLTFVLGLAVALAFGPQANAQDEPAPPDTSAAEQILLRFDWPVGLMASVTCLTSRVKESEGERDSIGVAASYDMTVASHPEGRLIRHANYQLLGLHPPGAALPVINMPLAELLQVPTPSIVVGDSGGFIRLQDMEASLRFMERLSSALADSLPRGSDSLRELMRLAGSERFLTAKAAERWNALVGHWAGAELEVGAVYTLETEEPSPLASLGTVSMYTELSLSERVPCRPQDACCDCVRLELAAYPDPAVAGSFVRSLLQGAMPDSVLAEMTGAQFAIETAVVVIAEPATLIPHSLEMTQSLAVTRGELDEATEPEFVATRQKSWSYRFDYGEQ
jgi:hypothetical protein